MSNISIRRWIIPAFVIGVLAAPLWFHGQPQKDKVSPSRTAQNNIPRMGPPTAENVRALAKKIETDEVLKRNVVAEMRKNLYGFVEKAFDLTPEQKKEMREKLPAPVADVLARTCIMVWQNNGAIDYKDLPEKEGDLRVVWRCPCNPHATGCCLEISGDP